MQGDGCATELGGIMEVAMWLLHTITSWTLTSLGLVPNYVVLVLRNEGGGPHHMQGHHTWGIGINLKKLHKI
jgi:hypothetical protein